jgi:hypothetical protein
MLGHTVAGLTGSQLFFVGVLAGGKSYCTRCYGKVIVVGWPHLRNIASPTAVRACRLQLPRRRLATNGARARGDGPHARRRSREARPRALVVLPWALGRGRMRYTARRAIPERRIFFSRLFGSRLKLRPIRDKGKVKGFKSYRKFSYMVFWTKNLVAISFNNFFMK